MNFYSHHPWYSLVLIVCSDAGLGWLSWRYVLRPAIERLIRKQLQDAQRIHDRLRRGASAT